MILISRVDPHQYDAAAADEVASGPDESPNAAGGPAAALLRVVAAATEADGRSPLNEATLLALRHEGLRDRALWLAYADSVSREIVGVAVCAPTPGAPGAPASGASGHGAPASAASGEHAAGPFEVNLVVTPEARGEGVGRALAETVLEAVGPAEATAWSHGNHPAAQRLAATLCLDRVRDLWVMRRPLGPSHPLPAITPGAGGVDVRPFRPGHDEDAFLALNAAAFAGHPEQGAMTRADLDQRMAEPWFDAAGFLVAEDTATGDLVAFHWTKVHDARVGEVYVVGVSPDAQGRGLGKLLTLAGLHHLAARGLAEVILYVEADNDPAVAVYSGLGFTHADADTDVMYRLTPGR